MEADAALVRADGVVELYAIADVVLHLAAVIDPCDTESDDAVGLDHALDDLGFLKLGMLVIYILHADQDLLDCLKILFFARVLGLEGIENRVYIHGNGYLD